MMPMLLSIGYHFCSFAMLNRNDWININVLVVLAFMLLSSFVYAISTFMPTATREKLRGAVRYEFMEGIVSLLLIALLILFAAGGCNFGAALTHQATPGQYTDPFAFSQHYVSDLLFVKAPSITTEIYSNGIDYLIDGFMVTEFIQNIAITPPTLGGSITGIGLTYQAGTEPAWLFFEYYGILTYFSAIIVVTFGLLFLLFLSLPIIGQLALTIIVPFSIVIRSFSFAGPRLRDAANTLFSIAMALYFILPLTLVMNSAVVNWVYCLNMQPGQCNPYINDIQSYTLQSINVGSLFTNEYPLNVGGAGGASVSMPFNFLSTVSTAQGGVFGFLRNIYEGLYDAPYMINTIVYQIAQYLFQGIVLIALDVAIVLGFAMGLAKGLNAVSNIAASGPFWSG